MRAFLFTIVYVFTVAMSYQFTSREYAAMIRAYFLCGENARAAVRMYRELYPNAYIRYQLLDAGQVRARARECESDRILLMNTTMNDLE